MTSVAQAHFAPRGASLALLLRLGLGAVFVVGGWAKLARLLDPAKSDAILTEYLGPLGYINTLFQDFLFSGKLPVDITPWGFMTALSGFELISGAMLMAGLLVRPLAVFWALLLWSFVPSLPVVTTPGVELAAATYTSPAMLVQIRDIGLSGLFFVLYALGPGLASLDVKVFHLPAQRAVNWDGLGLLLRLSLGGVLLAAGAFHGYAKVSTFGMPAWLLIPVGLGLVAGVQTRVFGAAAAAMMLVYMGQKIGPASSLLGYLNSVKREFGFLAAGACLAWVGGGQAWSLWQAPAALRRALRVYLRQPA